MPVGRKYGHVDPEFRDDHLRAPLIDPGHRNKTPDRLRETGEVGRDLVADGPDRLVEIVQVGQDLRDEKGVVPPIAGQGAEFPPVALRRSLSITRRCSTGSQPQCGVPEAPAAD